MDSKFRFLDLGRAIFYTAPELRAAKAREPQPGFDDRQRQVYRAPSQAGPGNDIHAGSPRLQKAPNASQQPPKRSPPGDSHTAATHSALHHLCRENRLKLTPSERSAA